MKASLTELQTIRLVIFISVITFLTHKNQSLPTSIIKLYMLIYILLGQFEKLVLLSFIYDLTWLFK